ncbi:MAG: AAA family ATPase [Gammaproteobacteria bacterium]|nr:AAA family ATPase [Gammaproteobacteria bacterium]
MSIVEKAIEKIHSLNKEEINLNRKKAVANQPPEELVEYFKNSSNDSVYPILERLKLQGIVTEGENAKLLDREIRNIKRPLLKSAFGPISKDEPHRNLLMVSSSLPDEGKTFISINIALSVARELGKTVLLVDADIAKPGVSKLLEVEDRKGLVDVLLNPAMDPGFVLIKTDVPGLTIMPAGGFSELGTELLASQRMEEVVKELARRYPDRLVIFDSSPLLLTTEAPVLAALMGQVVLVVKSCSTGQAQIKEAVSLLPEEKAINVILNKQSSRFGRYNYGSYGYY